MDYYREYFDKNWVVFTSPHRPVSQIVTRPFCLFLFFKANVDVIVVYMHWGKELSLQPRPYQLHITKHLVSLGVQVIIGSHPHVLQPHCIHGNKLIAYSLGNFLFPPSRTPGGNDPVRCANWECFWSILFLSRQKSSSRIFYTKQQQLNVKWYNDISIELLLRFRNSRDFFQPRFSEQDTRNKPEEYNNNVTSSLHPDFFKKQRTFVELVGKGDAR